MSGILPKMSGARMLYEKAPEAMGVSGLAYKEHQRNKKKDEESKARLQAAAKRPLLSGDEVDLA